MFAAIFILDADNTLADIDEAFTVQSISRPGETISSRHYTRRIGGKGANQAVAIARAGGIVDFYGTIGQDGEWLKTELRNHGLNVDGIIVSEVGIHICSLPRGLELRCRNPPAAP